MALADQGGAPAGGAHQVDEGVGVERERDAVVAHAVQRRHAPGHQRGAVWLADRARHIEAVEGDAARGERIHRGRADGAVAVAAEMIGAQLVGDEEEEIGSLDHSRSVSRSCSWLTRHLYGRRRTIACRRPLCSSESHGMTRSGSSDDARFMGLALALGRRGLGRTWPNPAVGAVVVRDDGAGPVIVGRGWTQPGGRPHAETEALRRAGAAAAGRTLYVTLEPCSHHGKTPPCVDAIIAAGIARVVSALEDPNPQVAGAGHRRLAETGIAVEVGVGAEGGTARACRPYSPRARRSPARDPQARGVGRRQGRSGRPAARSHHRREPRASGCIDARDERRGTHRHRHGARRRSAAHLPASGMANRSPVRVVLDSRLRLPARQSTGGDRRRDAALGHD